MTITDERRLNHIDQAIANMEWAYLEAEVTEIFNDREIPEKANTLAGIARLKAKRDELAQKIVNDGKQ